MKENQRILLVSCGVFCLFTLLVVQFFRVQIIQQNKWTRYAKAQHELVIKEPFKRGVFYSNLSIAPQTSAESQALVMDVPMFHLYIDPFQIPTHRHSQIATQLQKFLEMPTERYDFYMDQFNHQKSRSRKLEMWLNQKKCDEILAWWYPYAHKHRIARNAIYFISDYKRSYPFGSLLGPLLHTIQDNKEENTKQGIPTGGLEYYFNDLLKGREGKKKLLRSPKHPLDIGKVIEAPVDGADIYLTINHHLQAIAEKELEKGVKLLEANEGWAIIMDPWSGEIWAMAQYPAFDPKDYRNYYNDAESIDKTRLKSVCDSHEPGSIFKAFTIAICYLANEEMALRGKPPIFDPDEKVSTLSGQFPGRTKKLSDVRTHYYMNMYHAVQKSANIYMGRMIDRVINNLGQDWYRDKLHNTFGFGKQTGIEYPLEAPGLLPTPGKMNPNNTPEWSVPTPYSLAIGHNLLTNGIQIIRAFCTFANGGFLVKPTFVRKIIKKDENGNPITVLDHTAKERLDSFPRVISSEISEKMRYAMKFVVKNGGGGCKADVYGYTIAGKTGTANKIVNGEYSKKNYFSSFIGIAPANQPRFVLLVSLDEPATYQEGGGETYYGGKCAAPIFREIARKTLQYLGVVPDNPHNYPPGDPRRQMEKADFAKEVKELNALYEKWNSKP